MTEALFDTGAFQSFLQPDAVFGASFEYHGELSSTFDRARVLNREGMPHGTVILAERQTAGRGRLGRSFHSPGGTGLYFSLLLRPALSLETLLPLTAFAGVAVCESIMSLTDLRPQCKWPNDVLIGEKKVCGILAESVIGANVPVIMLGIGLNVNACSFPPPLEQTAVSLLQSSGRPVSREKLLAVLLTRLEDLLHTGFTENHDAWLTRYRALCVTPGRRVTITQGNRVRCGLALAVADSTALQVRFDDGTEELVHSGEVTPG